MRCSGRGGQGIQDDADRGLAGTLFVLPWTGSLVRALSEAGPQAGGAAIGSAVFLGLAPSAAGFVLWAYAMARLDVGRVTLSLYLVPAAAIGISLVWLGQAPGPVELIGGAVALAGVMLASGGRSRVAAGDEAGAHAQQDPGRQHRPGHPGPGQRHALVMAGQNGLAEAERRERDQFARGERHRP